MVTSPQLIPMDERLLAKILEYGKIPEDKALARISEVLELEFYYEEEAALYTLSNEFLVLDVSKDGCTLIFVDEALNTKTDIIRRYLSQFIHEKHIFFYLLRYLINCTKQITSTTERGSLATHKCICSCIFTGKYCQTYELSSVHTDFNIFTHEMLDLPLDYYFYRPNIALEKIRLPEGQANIARYIPRERFDRRCLDIFTAANGVLYEDEDVRVVNRSVYLNNKRMPIASLAFMRGCTLRDALEYNEAMEMI